MPSEKLPQIPTRPVDAHKGDFGLTLIVGGSRGMTGAIALAGMAALRGGAGLVRLAVPDRCLAVVAAVEPSYMTVPLADDAKGRIAADAYQQILAWADAATVVALGPGLGRSEALDELVGRLYRELDRPMIVDADAINALAMQPDVLSQPGGPRILTPHPGEFTRLIGRQLELPEREQAAIELAARCNRHSGNRHSGNRHSGNRHSGSRHSGGVVVVLKSHRTLITDGSRTARNTTGNPGMATGGSGDVLTGLIAALASGGLGSFEAAHLGCHLHGLSGDLAAGQLGQVSMIAGDLIQFLPSAIREFTGQ